MLYTQSDLSAIFPSSYLSRGQQYRKKGRVRYLAITENGSRITARVIGTRVEPYAVHIRINRSDGRVQIDTACTCPMGHDCKHAAATLLQALEEGKSLHPAPLPEEPAGDALPAPLAHWFERLSKTAERDGDYPDTVRDRLLYLLMPDGNAALKVRAIVVRLLKNGGYGRGREFHPYQVNYGQQPQYVTKVDLVILKELARQPVRQNRLAGSEGAFLLERMLATGRCHWQNRDGPVLAGGDPRPARLAWQTDEQGLTKLVLEAEPPATRVVPLDPPWYIDAEQNLAGPVRLEIPVPLALELAASPALRPEELPRVSAWLGDHLPALQVPPPPAIRVETLMNINPVPMLTLYTRPLQRYYESFTVDGAKVRFDYDGEVVGLEDSVEYFTCYRDGQLLEIRRQQGIEAARLRRLLGLGFQHLSAFYDSRAVLTAGIANDFGLENEDAWVHFMCEGVPRLRDEGWVVELDENFRFDLAFPDEWYADLDEGSGIDWFGLALGVEIDGHKVNLLPVLVDFLHNQPAESLRAWIKNLDDSERLMLTLPDGRLLPVPAGRVRAILDVLMELYDEPALDEDGKLTLPRIQSIRLAELEAALYGEPLRWQGGQALRELGERLRGATVPREVALPEGLNAELRPYQHQGLAWLHFLREYELGGILADDMGLGKTLQALAFLLAEKAAGRAEQPNLIVAPTSLMANWRQEAARFAPALKVLTLQGPQRHERFAAIPEHDIVLTTYALLPRDGEKLLQHEYHALILDESQAIKNPKSRAGLVARSLKAHHRLCLTGTPMENHLGELWSMFHFLMPGLLGDERQFRRLFRRPIEQFADGERRERLVRRIAPFMLRRTKEQVAKDLPEKTEIIRTVELHDAQRDLYESIRIAMQEKVRRAVRQKGLSRSHIVILDALLRLRQVCCDPRLLKMESARRFNVKRSAKLELLLELLGSLIEEGRRVLLFSQFTSMLELIEKELARMKLAHVKLTGDTLDRASPVERFQNGEVPLFLISLKAGGTGLNLTAADTVIHYDPWWNPAVEDQATDRAHRIGQEKPVFVYKLFTEGTVEERIRELQERKRALVDGVLEAESDGKAQWTDQDLEFLFAPLE